MNTVMVISQIILCALSVVVIIAVLMQKPADPNMGAAFGGQSNAYSKAMKARTAESKLNTITKICAVVLLCVSLLLVILQRFAG